MRHFLTFITLLFSVFAFGETQKKLDFASFFPENYILVSTVVGDINQDGKDDFILLIQDTDKNAFEQNKGLGISNRNRRGIVVLFDKGTHYEVASSNYSCLPPGNDGYERFINPELSIEISKEKRRKDQFFISYLSRSKDEYTSWKYTLRYQNGDFELIGYDKTSGVASEVLNLISIDFINEKRVDRVKSNRVPSDFYFGDLLRLRKIADFGNLEF